jgi:hypothetical protein
VGEAGERPPAHEQPVGLGQPAAPPCEPKMRSWESRRKRSDKRKELGLGYLPERSQTAARTKREAPR